MHANDHELEREALLTAYALHQLHGQEKSDVEALLAADPAAKTFVDQTRRLCGIVGAALKEEAAPAASASLASALDDHLTFKEVLARPAPKRGWRAEIAIGAVAGGLLAALMLPGVWDGFKEPNRVARNRTAESDAKPLQITPDRFDLSRADGEGKNDLPQVMTQDVTPNFSASTATDVDAAAVQVELSEFGQKNSRGFTGNNVGGISGTGLSGRGAAQRGKMVKAAGGGENGATVKMRSRTEERTDSKSYDSKVGAKPSKGQPVRYPASDLSAPKPAPTAPTVRLYNGQQEVKSEPQAQRYYGQRVTPQDSRSAVPPPRLPALSGDGQPGNITGVTEVASKEAKGESIALEELHKFREGDVPLPAEDFAAAHQPGSEQYEPIIENAFLPAKANALSTFSIDVDTASYANVRRFLTGGSLPPPSAVRIEEMINYFNYNDEQPKGNAPFAVHMEVAECPWTPGHHLLRIGLKGKEIAKDKRPNSNLVFLLDVSGSMQAHNKLPLVKEAMTMLTRELSENDMVTIVVYAGQEGLALDTTSGDQKDKIIGSINNLSAGGSTHASAGITLAYEMAQKNFLKEGTNRVILCTDGDFNVGITDDESLVKLISDKAKSNIFLSVLGFGMGNLKDGKMEKLADKGNGNYAYIDTSKEAKKVLVEQMTGSLVTIAKDVKIQIEFNPAMVSSYRQIGYENRVLAAKDFDDDTKDAGEIGAGHSVTALYEVVLVGQEEKPAAAVTVEGVPLKYQKAAEKKPEPKPEGLTDAAATGELLTVKLRFKEPTGDKSELIEFPLKQEPKRFGAASENLRFAAAVAEFGMLLRNSQYRGGATMSAVEEIATAASSHDPSGYRAEFVELVKKAEGLK